MPFRGAADDGESRIAFVFRTRFFASLGMIPSGFDILLGADLPGRQGLGDGLLLAGIGCQPAFQESNSGLAPCKSFPGPASDGAPLELDN